MNRRDAIKTGTAAAAATLMAGLTTQRETELLKLWRASSKA